MHLKARKKAGEEIRKKLLELGFLDKQGKILRERDFLFFPIKEHVEIPDTKIVEINGQEIKQRPTSLRDALKKELNSEELNILSRSFDLIGDIAILEIPEELYSKKELIGQTLIKTFKNIRVVALKKGDVEGKFRIHPIEVIAGEKRTETIHREYGCFYKLDIRSTYFSPRLGTERMRVASQVNDKDRVLVMFSGVGPYAILISKKSNAEVYAIELNPEAFRYMKENIKLNKVGVIPIPGDVRREVKKLGKFDRIVMPLPKGAGNFLDVALPALKKNGIIHFYDFSHNEDESIEKVKEICKELGYKIKILNAVKCGSYSPRIFRICVDFRVVDLRRTTQKRRFQRVRE